MSPPNPHVRYVSLELLHRRTTPPGEIGPPLPRLAWVYGESDTTYTLQWWQAEATETVSKDDWSRTPT